MNDLQLIKSEHFGEIEADIYSNGDDVFMTINQLAACLEYADKRAIEKLLERNAYLKNKEFSFIQKVPYTAGGTQNTRTFTEDGIYEITMLSGQPKAKEFRAWVRGILKVLRSGDAKLVSSADPTKKALADAKLNNSRARMASMWLKVASTVPVPAFKQICASYASEALAGKPVLPLPEVAERTYSAEEVGAMLGGVSGNKIGRIANQHGIKTPEYAVEVWDKSRYSGKQVPTWRYNERAVERFRDILDALTQD